jgi:Na+/proline symporter
LHGLPPEATSLALTPEFGWGYLAAWTLMVSFGYNTAAMAQRYFSVEDERAARRVALLCFGLFVVGAFIWFIPPFAMRVLRPDMSEVWPGLANPHESSYALAALTVLPNGLIGIMIAAMFSATVSGLTGLLNLLASILTRDIIPTLWPRRARAADSLAVGWAATFAVGALVVTLAMTMAARGQSVFAVMLTFNTVMSLAYGPPALLGLLVRRTPHWSGLASFAVGLGLGAYGTFVLGWGLVTNVSVVVPAVVAVFFATRLVGGDDPARAAARDRLFENLDRPVDVLAEVGHVPDRTSEVFRFLSRATAAVGLLSLLLLGFADPGERSTVVVYAVITLVIAVGLSLVRGKAATAAPAIQAA